MPHLSHESNDSLPLFSSSSRHRLEAVVVAAVSLVSGVGVSLLGPAPAAHAADLSHCADMTVVAHRGAVSSAHTENTVRSARLAVSRGAEEVEGDLRLSRDGVWVLMHDARVDRTTNGAGSVDHLRVSRIKGMRTNDGVRGGVPTLYQWLGYMRQHPGRTIQLEVKPSGASSSQLRTLRYRLRQFGVADRTLLTSFRPAVLRTLHAIDPSLDTALLSVDPVPASYAAGLGRTVVFRLGALSSSLVQAMQSAGLRVQTYTVDTGAEWRQAVTSGADGLITDDVAGNLALCRNVG